MSFVLRAFCYIKRKWKKTILLSGVFCITVFTILGTWEVLKVSEQIAAKMRKESNSRITVESMQEKNPINDEDVEHMKALENVNKINCVTEITAFANGFSAIFGAEDTNKIVLHGFDDMLKDSPFEEKICRIVSGRQTEKEGEVVINQRLAELNQIELDDELSFVCGEQTQTAKVVGFYLNGNENNQTDAVLTENRIENQIYTVNSMVFHLGNCGYYEKVIAYVDNPENLAETEKMVLEMLGEKASVGTWNSAYQKIKMSLSGTKRITMLVFVLMAITSVFITGSLLVLWMRNRKSEIAVFISMGISKAEIFMQMLVEILLTWSCSIVLAALCGKLLFPKAGAAIEVIRDMGILLSVSFHSVCGLWFIGIFMLMLLNAISLFPHFVKNPKEILSEMED